VIHLVVPVSREGPRGAGQWKDLQGIRLVLDRLGGFREFGFDGRNIGDLAGQIGDATDAVVWYYSFWPEPMEALRRRCPRARIVLRTVNAEALQHWTRARKDWRRLRGLPRDLYGCVRLLLRDRRSARTADALAGISPWDDQRYWVRLAGHRKATTVPYLCPWPELLPGIRPRPWGQREDLILCLPGSRDAIGHGHLEAFARLAARPELVTWRFAASAGFADPADDRLPESVERLGHLDEPWEWLCRVKAVAVLSPHGHGCKTTVADALAAGCHVLMHPRQHARLSPGEQAVVLPVDTGSDDGIGRLADRLADVPAIDAAKQQQAQWDHSLAAWSKVLTP
jgi:hypothetical protein